MEDVLKGSWIEKKVHEIQKNTVLELQIEINMNFNNLPEKFRPAFTFVLKKDWQEIIQTYGALSNKSYEELKKLREPLMTLGDLSGSDDVHELVMLTMVNKMVYRDPKVEMHIIKRLTNTRTAKSLIDRIRSFFSM